MFQDKFVFAQLVAFFDRSKFNRIVAKYNGDRYVKHLTCWNQFLAMMFGQLSNRESLRDLIVALEAHHSKCYHLGMGKNVQKSSLARANQDRDYRIFEEYAFYLVSEVRKKCSIDIFKLDGNVYAFDSTTIDLCLEVFWWAKFRKKKGGEVYYTNDTTGSYFPEAYFLDSYDEQQYFETIEEAAESVSEIVGCAVEATVNAIQEALEKYVEQKESEGEEVFYSLHEFQVIDD